jgi:hypothetical protein
MPFIAPLSCALVERSGAILFQDGSRIGAIYGKAEAEEEYHCNYGLNPRHEHILSQSQLKIGARDPSGEVRAVELEGHPFFLATLFQPERAALKGKAHPPVNAYVAAAASLSLPSCLAKRVESSQAKTPGAEIPEANASKARWRRGSV